jgi:hypothetical protein
VFWRGVLREISGAIQLAGWKSNKKLYCLTMPNTVTSKGAGELNSLSEKLKLAEQALEAYRTRCFWSLSPDFRVTETTMPIIIEGLRRHGDMAAFQLAALLCR